MRLRLLQLARVSWMLMLSISLLGCAAEADHADADSEASHSEVESDADGDGAEDSNAGGERVTVSYTAVREALSKDPSGVEFLGKQLVMQGEVEAIEAEGAGYLLFDSALLKTVEAQPWTKVLPGQQVTLVGTFTEEAGLKIKIESVEGDRLVVQAKELGQEFQSDKAATNAKYDGKWMEVQGTILNSKVADADIVHLTLEGIGENNVLGTIIPLGQEEAIKNLKPGNQIRMVGKYTSQAAFETPIVNFCLLITE